MQYWEEYLTNYVQNLHTENYKLLREIKEGLNKCGHGVEDNIPKMSIFSNSSIDPMQFQSKSE